MKYSISSVHARQIAIAVQGLDRRTSDPAEALERYGFVRTLGGADVYLALRARTRDFDRARLDALVAEKGAQVVPSVRGCIYLVSRNHVPASLHIADQLSARRMERDLRKVGIEEGEIEALGRAVLEALDSEDDGLTTHRLRARLPTDLLRPLGEVGKKVGLTSPLPPTLRRLEFAGRLERTLEGGRLDTERYLWRRKRQDPADTSAMDPAETPPSETHTSLARIFLRAAGVATPRAFAAWSGLGQRDAKTAFAGLEILEVAVEGEKEARFVLTQNEPLLDPDSARIAAGRSIAFLPFEDNLLALHEGPRLFVDPAHHGIEVSVWGRGRGNTLGDVRHSSLRPIIAEGRMVGFWELDPDTGEQPEVVWVCFDPVRDQTRERLAGEAEALGRFLLDEIGHGRSFSIDTEAKMAKRARRIRELQG